jgi:hypothetical protein
MFARHECATVLQASPGMNLAKGLLGPVEVLKAVSAEHAVGVAFL